MNTVDIVICVLLWSGAMFCLGYASWLNLQGRKKKS